MSATILRETEQHVGSKYVDQVLDSLFVLERSMRHFFVRAEIGKNAGRKQSEVDADYEKAARRSVEITHHNRTLCSFSQVRGVMQGID